MTLYSLIGWTEEKSVSSTSLLSFYLSRLISIGHGIGDALYSQSLAADLTAD